MKCDFLYWKNYLPKCRKDYLRKFMIDGKVQEMSDCQDCADGFDIESPPKSSGKKRKEQ